MYKSSKIAKDMVWHHKANIKDDILRHPTYAKVWKDSDEQNPTIVVDLRNVRL